MTVTVVTAMYDIGRHSVDGRSMADYKTQLLATVRCIQEPMVLFLDSSLGWKQEVMDARKGLAQLEVIETPLSEIPMWKYLPRVRTILSQPGYSQRVKYPQDITNRLPEYCILQYSKFGWVQDVIARNPFQSQTFVWMDAGYSRFFPTSQQYSSSLALTDAMLVQVDPSVCTLGMRTPDNYIGTCERIVQGGLWATTASVAPQIFTAVLSIWEQEMIAKGRIDNEQIALALVVKEQTNLFTLCESKHKMTTLFHSMFTTVQPQTSSKTITELFTTYGSSNFREGTDKYLLHSYAPVYEYIFAKYKDSLQNLLEIGIATGGALAAYSAYFENANIYGIDIADKRLPQYMSVPRTTVFFGDALQQSTIQTVANIQFDMIIEDASHDPEHQKQHFTDFSKFVKPGGVYIIEDVHVDHRNAILQHVSRVGTNFICTLVDLTREKGLPDDNMIICVHKS